MRRGWGTLRGVSRRIKAYESRGNRWEDDFVPEEEGPSTARQRRARLETIREGEGWIAVAKPPGMPVVPTRHGSERTVIDAVHAVLGERAPGAPRPVVCHRLDMATSGVLVVAKQRDAAKALMRQFRGRSVRKSYLALVTGAPQPPEGVVEFRVAPDRKRPGAMWTPRTRGKACRDEYETLETFRGVSWVRVRPGTGRMHEVRLALRTLGTPCAVDPLYGSPAPLMLSDWKATYRTGRGRAERPLVARLTLHAETLEFTDPTGDERVSVSAPLPRDLAATLKQLRRHAAPGTL